MGIATAEPKPQDPYADPVAATPAKKPAKATEPRVEIDWDATLEQVGPFTIGGAVLLTIICTVRARRARRLRTILENRRTQFGLSAIDPDVLQQHRAAWENAPVVTPAAIDPSSIAPSPIRPIIPLVRRPRMAQGSEQPLMVAAVAPRAAAMVMHPFGAAAQPPVPAYPLTFAASTLTRTTRRGHAAVVPNIAAQRWDDTRTETGGDDEAATDFVIQFARGSQDEALERTRARMHALAATVVLPKR